MQKQAEEMNWKFQREEKENAIKIALNDNGRNKTRNEM